MSLHPLIRQVKKNEIKSGVHLVVINDMIYLRNAAKEIIKTTEGYPTIIVQFKKSKEELHEKHYLIDKGYKQKYFDNMLRIAQVDTNNGAPKKTDIIGKKLWIAVQEIHYVDDDQIVLDENESGNAKIDYHIFKVFPYVEGGRKPIIKGDPEMNNGIASEDFITYKNISNKTDNKNISISVKDELEISTALDIAKKHQNKDNEPIFE